MRKLSPLLINLFILAFLLAGCSASLSAPDSAQAALPVAASPAAASTWNVTYRVPLAPKGYELVDLRADATRIYVVDSADQLHILDRLMWATMQTIAVKGERLTLDAEHGRLYVAPGNRYIPPEETPQITVFDTQTLAPIGSLPGRFVSVDSAHNRIYTGTPLTLETEQAMTAQAAPSGVRLFDGNTLLELRVGAQPGIPVYNPARDELLIVAYTVYTANAQTLAVERDLLPGLVEQELRWCTGCIQAMSATIFPAESGDHAFLMVALARIGGGKGGGLAFPMQWRDAHTLSPVDVAPTVEQTCGSEQLLRPAVDGRVYRSLFYSRYQEIHNMVVEERNGATVRQIDGLQLLYADEQTGQGIAALSSTQNFVIDLATGTPSGFLPAFRLLAADAQGRRIWGAAGRELLQVEPTAVLAQPSSSVAASDTITLPMGPFPIHTIITPDPNNPQHQLGLNSASELQRSADGGRTWQGINGELPQWAPTDLATVTVAASPNYAVDKTLFWAGVINERNGLGVWRSSNGGESWHAVWAGLDHLRVTKLQISPNFPEDGTLWATADFALLTDNHGLDVQKNGAASADAAPESSIQTGRSLWKSTNRGEGWHLIATALDDAGLPVLEKP